VKEPLAASPGWPARQDYEYEREGTANLFIVCELLVEELVEDHYPHAKKIVVVLENLNTHTPAALYEAFDPAEARRRSERLEIHYTPKHGSRG